MRTFTCRFTFRYGWYGVLKLSIFTCKYNVLLLPCFSIVKKYKKIKEDGWVQEDPVCVIFTPFSIITQYKKKLKEDGWVQEDPVAAGASRGLPHPQGPLHSPRQGI